MSNWILCNERLPKHEEDVLVTIKPGTEYWSSYYPDYIVVEAVFYAEDPDDPNERDFFRPWDLEGPHYHSEVTAWMPLPEPYRP